MKRKRRAVHTRLTVLRPVAQLAECLSPKQEVASSILAWPAWKVRNNGTTKQVAPSVEAAF